jgi:hypothetical protein
MARVLYCTAVYARWDTFSMLLDSFLALTAQPDNQDDRLCVYDWDSSGKDIFEPWPDRVSYHAGHEHGHINRAAARNKSMTAANPAVDDLVFFVDCDMVLPLDFSQRVRTHVKLGHAYFPVCYSLYRNAPLEVRGDGPPYNKNGSTANGWWRESGRGNCGFVVSDFFKLGGWDGQRWGPRYGREDDDVYWRAYRALEVYRERVPGFFHQWHPKPPEEKNPSARKK